MSVNIHGKDYWTVAERLQLFRKDHPEYSVESDIIQVNDQSVIIRSIIKNDNGRILSTGIATEMRQSSKINSTNYIENCETSAVGRALAFFGYGIDGSICSADEVQSAIVKQTPGGKSDELLSKIEDLMITKQIPDKMQARLFELMQSGMSISKMNEVIAGLEKLPDMEFKHE